MREVKLRVISYKYKSYRGCKLLKVVSYKSGQMPVTGGWDHPVAANADEFRCSNQSRSETSLRSQETWRRRNIFATLISMPDL